MKKTIITSVLIFLFSIMTIPGLRAQDNYNLAMTSALGTLDAARSQQEFLATSMAFERIAVAEKDQWLPWYYTALALVLPSLDEPDGARKDQLLDRAQEGIDRAMELAPGESEIHVLQAFLYPSRILVDPVARGMLYMERMSASLAKARELNPDNPRVYYLEAVQKANLPEAFGGGAEIARPLFEKSMVLYRADGDVDPLLPSWGEDHCTTELEKLNSL